MKYDQNDISLLNKLKNFHLNSISSKGYSFAMETVYQIHKRGINIKQIPISFRGRLKGYSKIPKIELFRTLINIFRLKFLNKNWFLIEAYWIFLI